MSASESPIGYDADDENKTVLLRLIQKRDWLAATSQASSFPDEVTTWSVVEDSNKTLRFLPLHKACESQPSLAFVETLLKLDPNGAKSYNQDFRHPLHCACDHNASAEVIHVLISAHTKGLQWQDHKGCLPLHYACIKGAYKETISALIYAYPEGCAIKDNEGLLPIHHACNQRADYVIIATLLLYCPKGVRRRDNHGRLPLHYACHKNTSKPVLNSLLKVYPKSVFVKDDSDYLPIDYARQNGAPDSVIELLSSFCMLADSRSEARDDVDSYSATTPIISHIRPTEVVVFDPSANAIGKEEKTNTAANALVNQETATVSTSSVSKEDALSSKEKRMLAAATKSSKGKVEYRNGLVIKEIKSLSSKTSPKKNARIVSGIEKEEKKKISFRSLFCSSSKKKKKGGALKPRKENNNRAKDSNKTAVKACVKDPEKETRVVKAAGKTEKAVIEGKNDVEAEAEKVKSSPSNENNATNEAGVTPKIESEQSVLKGTGVKSTTTAETISTEEAEKKTVAAGKGSEVNTKDALEIDNAKGTVVDATTTVRTSSGQDSKAKSHGEDSKTPEESDYIRMPTGNDLIVQSRTPKAENLSEKSQKDDSGGLLSKTIPTMLKDLSVWVYEPCAWQKFDANDGICGMPEEMKSDDSFCSDVSVGARDLCIVPEEMKMGSDLASYVPSKDLSNVSEMCIKSNTSDVEHCFANYCAILDVKGEGVDEAELRNAMDEVAKWKKLAETYREELDAMKCEKIVHTSSL